MLYRVGTNQYKAREVTWFQQKSRGLKRGTWVNVAIGILVIISTFYIGTSKETYSLISPIAHAQTAGSSAELLETIVNTPTPTPVPQIEMMDIWIGKYVDMFAKTDAEKSKWRYYMHCIANHESSHHYNKKDGDDGLAHGLMQFHHATYVEYRTRLMDRGLVSNMGSEYDDEDAIETMAFAISQGAIGDWGTYWTYCNN